MWICIQYIQCLALFGVFNRELGAKLLQRWTPRPMFLDGTRYVVRPDSIESFARARVAMERPSTFVVVTLEPEQILYVLRPDGKGDVLESIVWQHATDRVAPLRALVQWHYAMRRRPLSIGRVSEKDRDAWDAV